MTRVTRMLPSLFCAFASLAGLVSAPVAVCAASPLSPPLAHEFPVADTTNGDVRIDYYAWMRDREDPDVIAYLEAENAYTDAVMEHTKGLQDSLYKEIVGRIKETDLSVPYRKGDYFYYWRSEEGKDYRIFCRKAGSLDAPEQILLDQNELSEGHDYFDIWTVSVSPDHSMIAYLVDTTGAEDFTLHVLDIATGELLDDVIEGLDYDLVWGNDNRTIFYTTTDDARRADKLWRHVLGTPVDADVLIYHEPDESFWVSVYRTRSDRYLIMEVVK